ncbi:MAG: MOSC domain-containing protein [Phaeodactylibacter sp.]|nr:MOSC domain-containing protein [Phaeodactylibacter sp.]MCB9050117.1 MOSC domain-containing protein [Lewinellaceae bacterium]
MRHLHITSLLTYPIKSLAGISLPRARVEKRGLAYDRRWMLVDRDGLFISQREIPELALLLPDFTVHNLIIRHRFEGLEPLSIPLHPPPESPAMEVQVWDDRCTALQVSREADEWFSDVLHTQCHLVYLPDESIRPVNPSYGRPGEITSFADSCPLLVIGEASLADLNARLEEPVPMNRFRPNIVFAGGQPYEEESWKSFHIGDVQFRGIRPCARCQITTINQDTAEMGREPLRTLSTYRRQGHKILFGLNASWIPKEGAVVHVQVGDEASPNPSEGGG